jgi:hypothetical protein
MVQRHRRFFCSRRWARTISPCPPASLQRRIDPMKAAPYHPAAWITSIYHYPECRVVKKIKPANRVKYKEAPAGKCLHQECPQQ